MNPHLTSHPVSALSHSLPVPISAKIRLCQNTPHTPDLGARLAAAGVTLHALCTWWDVLAAAREGGAFDAGTLAAVEAYLRDPEGWAP